MSRKAYERQATLPLRMLLRDARAVDASGRRLRPGIAWHGGMLSAAATQRSAGWRLGLSDHLVFPGLVNAHDHLHLNVFPALPGGGDANLVLPVGDAAEWVQAMRLRIERPDHVALRALPVSVRAWHGALKNLLAGSTAVMHHDPPLKVFRRREFPVRVLQRVGWAHSLGLASSYGPSLDDAWRSRVPGRPWFIHLAEGRGSRAAAEFKDLLRVTGPDAALRLVHGVGMTSADRRMAIASGMGLIACPISNQRLLGRPGPIRDFAAIGRAGLGSDSRVTGGRDLLAELRFARTAGLASATQLLSMVSDGAARLCGEPRLGRLSPGRSADLIIVVDDGRPPAAQLCSLQRADLRLVLRNGRPQVADRDFEGLFEATGTPWRQVVLDGVPKLIARRLLDPLDAAGIAEPGLEPLG
jgi:cytosine/adenosine deaminase-related metal-dependent hydrolase